MDLTTFLLIVFVLGFICHMYHETYRLREDNVEYEREYRAKIAARHCPKIHQPTPSPKLSLRYRIKQVLGWPREIARQFQSLCYMSYKLYLVRS